MACKFKFRALGPKNFPHLGSRLPKDISRAYGYQFAEFGPCGYCSFVARGDRRERLKEEKEEETEEKTKHHNHKIYAGLHPGIDKNQTKQTSGTKTVQQEQPSNLAYSVSSICPTYPPKQKLSSPGYIKLLSIDEQLM